MAHWWQNEAAIVYRERGKIDPSMVEARVMRAICLDAIIRVERPRMATSGAAFVSASLRPVVAIVPTEADRRDYHVAMSWLSEVDIDPSDWTILRGRSLLPPVGWVMLGDVLDVSAATARGRYRRLIGRLTAAANRGNIRCVTLRRALQDRNRAHRGQSE